MVERVVSDANVLIDMDVGSLSEPMLALESMSYVVPDLLFEQELKVCHAHLLDMGLERTSLSGVAVAEVFRLAARFRRVSRMDLFALVLAAQMGSILLTGDRELRKVAKIYRVECHGTVWMVERLIEEGRISPRRARNGYLLMRAAGSRLPWTEAERTLKERIELEVAV